MMSVEDEPDSSIDHAAAIQYWNGVDATVNGMLGGYPHISRIDLQGSSNFVAKLRRSRTAGPSPPSEQLRRAVDCGAGIGRVTNGLLSKFAAVVDVVEPVEKFTREIKDKLHVGEIYNVGLEDWQPQHSYDLIWMQWCLGHLTDAQLVLLLHRCTHAFASGGWIVVKENTCTTLGQKDLYDEVDNSVTRADGKFRTVFETAGLKIVATEVQKGFPKELFPVRMYALRPDENANGEHP